MTIIVRYTKKVVALTEDSVMDTKIECFLNIKMESFLQREFRMFVSKKMALHMHQ